MANKKLGVNNSLGKNILTDQSQKTHKRPLKREMLLVIKEMQIKSQ